MSIFADLVQFIAALALTLVLVGMSILVPLLIHLFFDIHSVDAYLASRKARRPRRASNSDERHRSNRDH